MIFYNYLFYYINIYNKKKFQVLFILRIFDFFEFSDKARFKI